MPSAILNKPGALTPEETAIVRQHPETGAQMLLHEVFSPVTRAIVREHHERWDGLGYPEGLSGNKIHQLARIAAVADVYDAVTSERPYKPAQAPHVGVEVITSQSGTAFDPEVVEVFRRIVHPYPVGSEVEVPGAGTGVVAAVDAPTRPTGPLRALRRRRAPTSRPAGRAARGVARRRTTLDVMVHDVLHNPLEPPFPEGLERAIFGMGCFWGAERMFWQAPGVWTTAVGYAGGYTPQPSYEQVCTGRTGHAEVVLAVFDPAATSYEEMLRIFWEGHDPTQGIRQGNDVGHPVPLGDLLDDRGAARRGAGVEGDVPGAPEGGGPRRDHHGDRAGRRVLLRRALPPAVPPQGAQRLLRPGRDRASAARSGGRSAQVPAEPRVWKGQTPFQT